MYAILFAQTQAAQPTQKRPGGTAAAAAPGRITAPTRDDGPQRTQPDGQLRPRKTTAQTTRTRQRRAAQAAQTAVGDAQLRILLRDDHVATTANKRFRRTQRRQKAAFLWSLRDFFWPRPKETPQEPHPAKNSSLPTPAGRLNRPSLMSSAPTPDSLFTRSSQVKATV